MARVTLMPRGQASTQLKIVRQRHTPSLEFRISRRSSRPSSRLSKMNRWALTMAAGPTYSGLAQNDGQEVVHAAQRMQRVVSSNTSRSLGDCIRSFRSEEHTSELQSPCNLVC